MCTIHPTMILKKNIVWLDRPKPVGILYAKLFLYEILHLEVADIGNKIFLEDKKL